MLLDYDMVSHFLRNSALLIQIIVYITNIAIETAKLFDKLVYNFFSNLTINIFDCNL